MKALIVVDVQYDFLPGGSLAVLGSEAILPIVKKLQATFEAKGLHVIATQDWHPPDHGSFASVHGKPAYSQGELGGLPQTMWPDHCVQGSRGAEMHHEFKFDRIVRKGQNKVVDSYSGFFDNNHGEDTGLHALLQELGVTELYVVGLATDYCVKFTALDARSLGYDVKIVVDGTRGVDMPPGTAETALMEMQGAGCVVVDSHDVLKELGVEVL